MTFAAPIPFAEALQKLQERGIVPSALSSAEWAEVLVALRERAFFSSRVESARLLQSMRDEIEGWLLADKAIESHGGYRFGGRTEFVANMRELAMREGLGRIDPETGEIDPNIRESDLTDIRSIRRLELIFDTQVEAAQEHGYWIQGQDPDILAVFPAQRFIRVRPVMAPRPYHEAALGEVRRKDDLKFWLSLNRDFGVPWGPWGFGSGCGVEDVDRDEAVELGVMNDSDEVMPVEREFNEGLSAGIRDLDGDIATALARISGGSTTNGRLMPRKAKKPAPAKALATNMSTILSDLGLDDPATVMTEDHARRLIEQLQEDKPIKGTTKLGSLKGAQRKGSGTLTKDFIHGAMDDFVSFLPAELVQALPEISIVVKPSMSGAGSYNEKEREVNLSKASLQNPATARKTIFHELIHWAHDHGTPEFRKQVADFYASRTAGEKVVRLRPWNSKKITGKRDKWLDADGDEYAARIYSWETTPVGTEVVTRHLEKLSDPAAFARNWNHKADDGTFAWREAFLECSTLLFPSSP